MKDKPKGVNVASQRDEQSLLEIIRLKKKVEEACGVCDAGIVMDAAAFLFLHAFHAASFTDAPREEEHALEITRMLMERVDILPAATKVSIQ